ncbi:MAG: hypothetical protein KDK71_10120 [Chlamydiia bacterium]|nr:hypothetical protein [Chlamydiia bacterium]
MSIVRSTISYVNQEQLENECSYIFVNGVNNNLSDAEAAALEVSAWLGNKRVVLFYNPTDLNTRSTTALQINLLAKSLLILIQNEFNRCQSTGIENSTIKIRLLAHSHGSILAKLALQELSVLPASFTFTKSNIEAFSFGGVLIPDDIASKVNNFVNEFDFVPVIVSKQIPSDSDVQRFLNWAQFSQEVSRIFSETLAYERTSQQENASKALESAFFSYFQLQDFARNDPQPLQNMMAKIVDAVLPFASSVVCGYSVSIKRKANSPTLTSQDRLDMIEIIQSPYKGESLKRGFSLISKYPAILDSHSIAVYLGTVEREHVIADINN